MGLLNWLFGNKEDTKPRCKYCNAVINGDEIFCNNCGKKLMQTEPYKLCKYCNTKNSPDVSFCINCGKNIADYSKNYKNNEKLKSSTKGNIVKDNNYKEEKNEVHIKEEDKKKYYKDIIEKGIEEGLITFEDFADKVKPTNDFKEIKKEDKDVYDQLLDEFEFSDLDIEENKEILQEEQQDYGDLLEDELVEKKEKKSNEQEIEDIMGLFSDEYENLEPDFDEVSIPKRIYKLDNKFFIISKYDNISQAAIENGIEIAEIERATRDVKKYAGIYKWCYADDYLDKKLEYISSLKQSDLENQILEEDQFLSDINEHLEELQNSGSIISKESKDNLKVQQDRIQSCIEDVNAYRNGLSLPSTLLKSIELFIKNNPPCVYYSVIYGNYKARLTHIKDIPSLKKIIDGAMPSEYFKNKDYISTFESKTEVNRYIYNTISEMENFSIYDINKKMRGLSWPRLEFLIQKLIDDKRIKEIKGKDYSRYIKISSIKDYEEDSKILSNNKRIQNTITKINERSNINTDILTKINELFETINTDTISVKKVYARLKIFYSDLLDKNNIQNSDELETYLMKNYMNNGLYFKGSYISNKPISNVKLSIIKHFSSDKRITKSDYVDFISTTGLSVSYNYYSLIRDIKELSLIDGECAINSDNLDVSESDVKRLNSVLEMFFRNNENMFTKNINIKMFPNLDNYSMNKYLLISIINKYLSDKYETSLIDISTNNCDYLVRRIKK